MISSNHNNKIVFFFLFHDCRYNRMTTRQLETPRSIPNTSAAPTLTPNSQIENPESLALAPRLRKT